MRKALKKLEIEGVHLSMTKVEFEKPVAKIIVNGKTQECYLQNLEWGKLLTLSSYSIADDKILYLKDSKDTIRKFSTWWTLAAM